MVDHLLDEGHEAHVYAHHIDSNVGEGPVFHYVPAPGVFGFMKILTFMFFLRSALARSSYDIVHHQIRPFGPGIVTAAGGCHCAYLRVKNAGMTLLERLIVWFNPLDYLIMALERHYYVPGRIQKIIANSNFNKQGILSQHDIPEDMVAVIHNGVDSQYFSPENRQRHRDISRHEFGFSSQDLVILFIGSNFRRKGLYILMDALLEGGISQMDRMGIKLLVVGHDEVKNRHKYSEIISRTVFPDTSGDVIKFYAAADIFITPTVFDPFANTTIEAMSAGLPVITTESDGVSDIIEDSVNGYFLSSTDKPEHLLERIVELTNEKTRGEIGYKARNAVLGYSWEMNIKEQIDLYYRVLETNSEL